MERGSERGAKEGKTEECKNHSLASLKHIIKVKIGRERERASLQSRREVTEKPQSTQRAANMEEEIQRKSVSKYFFMPFLISDSDTLKCEHKSDLRRRLNSSLLCTPAFWGRTGPRDSAGGKISWEN